MNRDDELYRQFLSGMTSAYDELMIFYGGSLIAASSYINLYAESNISITGSTVAATASNLDGINSGIGSVTITDSTVTTEGSRQGISAGWGSLTVSGEDSVVTAEGGTAAIDVANGVTLNDGLVYIEGSADAAKAVIAKGYTVTYKVTGGTWADGTTVDKTETVAAGAKPAKVPTGMIAAKGYRGGNWDAEPTEAITDAKTYTYSFELIPTYTVTYKVVNGTWADGTTEDKTETVASGSSPASVPAGMTASDGYTGGAWDTDPGTATISEDTTFIYTFEKAPVESYTVTYKVVNGTWSDGTKEDKTETVVSGASPASVPAGMTASDGYTGGGWDTDPGTATISEDTIFTYTFDEVSPVTYTIKFVNEDGTVLQTSNLAYGEMPTYSGKTPAKEADAQYSYTFAGWDPEIAEVTGDAVYTAVYTATPVPVKKGTLTFDLGGGTLDGKTGTITIEANVGDTIKLPGMPTREGYTFQYWKGSQYEAGAEYTVEGDHAFTAEWEKNEAKTYTVTFDANGHGTAPAAQTVEEGKKASKPQDPTASGYTFGGWFTDKECKNAFDFETAVTKDITLYAKWTAKESSAGSTTGPSTSGGTAVKTGDESNVGLWLILMAASLLVLILIAKKRKDISR